MFYDIEARTLIAREHAEFLRAAAESAGEQRARRWLSERLIAAGMRLAPERAPRRDPLRAA